MRSEKKAEISGTFLSILSELEFLEIFQELLNKTVYYIFRLLKICPWIYRLSLKSVRVKNHRLHFPLKLAYDNL